MRIAALRTVDTFCHRIRRGPLVEATSRIA
jgi:hypothetical protein